MRHKSLSVIRFAFLVFSFVAVVSWGCQAAYAAGGSVPVAYTANTELNTVSVIDMRDDTIYATIYEVDSPAGLAITPAGKWLYVTDGETNKVTCVNMTSYRVTGTIPVGGSPCGIAMAPDGGTAYVTNYGDNTVSVINTTSKKVNRTINVGKGPCGIKINPVNGEVYVMNSDDNTVAVIRDMGVVATIPAGDRTAKGLAVTPDGSRLLVANTRSNTVSIINTTTYKVINTVNVGIEPTGIAISPNGWYAYITNPGSRNISDMLISDCTVRVSFSMDNASLIAFGPDGKMAYVLTETPGAVRAMDSNTGDVRTTIRLPAADIETGMVSGSTMVDNVKPESSLNLGGVNNSEGAFIGSVTCNITAVDYPSGTAVTNSEYSYDGMTWLPYTGNFTLTNQGRTIIQYRSTDKYGNQEWPKSRVIYVVAGAAPTGPTPLPTLPPANGSIWTGPSATVEATVPQNSVTPKPTGGFEATLAAIGVLSAGYLIRKRS